MIKLSKVSMYQAVEIPVSGKKINGNTISAEVYPGVEITLQDHIITISNPDWENDILVGTSNMRYAVAEKTPKVISGVVATMNMENEMRIRHEMFKSQENIKEEIISLEEKLPPSSSDSKKPRGRKKKDV